MRRGCLATGRMMHKFDPATHRCLCGRWQAGFKPKKEPVRPRAECQICEKKQALDSSGSLGHHGYRRPGYGSIEGDCPGVGYLPYPAIDALTSYLQAVERHLEERMIYLRYLETVTALDWSYEARVDGKREKRSITIKKEGPSQHIFGYVVPSFDDLLKRQTVRTQSDIISTRGEKARVEARIASARK